MTISLLALGHTGLVGYNKYISSQEWRDKANLAKERDGYQCRTCTSTQDLEVHHRTYERFRHEDLDDLITLCKACHDAITSSIRFRRYDSREIRVYDAERTTPTYNNIGDQNVKQNFEVQDSRRITPVNAQRTIGKSVEQIFATDEAD